MTLRTPVLSHYDYIHELATLAEERGWYIQGFDAGSVTLARGNETVRIESFDPLALVRDMPVRHPTRAEDR